MSSAKLPEVRLRHMLEHIDGILAATRGQSLEGLDENYVLARAIERAVQIISEAAKELPPDLRGREPDVPWAAIIGVGNLLRHEYYRIRGSYMVEIVTVHLPRLRPAVLRLIDELQR